MSAKPSKEWTLMHQGKLPPLPLPELGQTCDKYLRSVQPVLTEDEYRHTKFVVDTFRTGIGKVLHEKLKLRAKESKNWLAEWWADTYVDYRGPLPYFSNFGGTTDYSSIWQQPEIGSQVYRASVILYTVLQKHLKIQRQQWPISMLKKKIPMDMILYYGFFASGRLPGYERDRLANYSIKDGSPSCTMRHIVVIKRRRFYQFDAMTPSYAVITPPEFEMQLRRICELADATSLGPGVGSLTSTDRPTWKKVQDHLFALHPKNEKIVDILNKALVVCVLDDSAPGSQNASTCECIIGDSSNRWYDKGNQCIFFKDGFIGNNNDHAHIDGFMSSEIFEDVLEDVLKCKGKWQGSNDVRELPWPVELEFKVDDYVMGEIEIARNKHDAMRSAAGMIDKPILNFGKRFAKEVNIHPDAMIQMAVQLAYYRMHQRCVPTYETATTRQFHIGRTETLRVCTVESKAFVEAMDKKGSSTSTKVKLLREACEMHGKMMGECTNGQGIDRHLLGLRNVAKLEGLELPKIYVDKAWKASGGDGNFVLSTSLSGYRTVHGGMGPMTLDGYGVFYTIENDRIHVVVGTIDKEKTDCYRMREEIEKAFCAMREILISPKL